MRFGRILSTLAAVAAVVVIAAVVLATGRTSPTASDQPSDVSTGPSSSIPALLPATSTQAPTTAKLTPSTSAARSTPASTSPARSTPAAPSTSAVTHAPVTHAPVTPSSSSGQSLPLGYSTGNATRVITFVAHSYSSTSGTLQAWNKTSGGKWVKYGPSIPAWNGSDGLTQHMSEFRSATQVGSFTLTQAFGRDSNPGTSLPYLKTQPDDWWISEGKNKLYNTHQRCDSHCSFTLGSPNEQLYYARPDYDIAVVIDYNTPNAGPVIPNAGSAVFLHVTEYKPTAGCISIPKSNLITIMKWLTPSAHPRILIGVN